MKRPVSPKSITAALEIGAHIKTWRLLLELRADQVAERAGISLGTLRKIESGDLSVGLTAFLETLRSLALLQRVISSLDPLETDIGRAKVTDTMPKRIKSRKLNDTRK